jgi:hypothetical protein
MLARGNQAPRLVDKRCASAEEDDGWINRRAGIVGLGV